MKAAMAMIVCMARVAAAVGGAAAALDTAREAYDDGRFDEAAGIYETMISEGVEAPEVRFNLGNARFRLGDAGRAVLEYRRAWRRAPRDPDISANLNLALDIQGAPRPREPHWTAWPLERIAPSEAGWMAMLGWWVALILLAGSLGARGVSVRLGLRKASAAAALAGAVGLVVLMQWRTRDAEFVVVEAGRSARFAPLDDASVHFSLPVGSIIDAVERQGPWLKIRLSGKEGWVPRSIVEPVAVDVEVSSTGR